MKQNNRLAELYAPELPGVGLNLDVRDNNKLVAIDLSKLVYVGRSIIVRGNRKLRTLKTPKTTIYHDGSNTWLNLPNGLKWHIVYHV